MAFPFCIPEDIEELRPFDYQVHQIHLPPTQDDQFGPIANIGTIAFDTHEELLWVGNIHVSALPHKHHCGGRRHVNALELGSCYLLLLAHGEAAAKVHSITSPWTRRRFSTAVPFQR